MDVDSYGALIYGSYRVLENFYIDGVAMYGWNDYDEIRRHIIYNMPSVTGDITKVNQLAKSDTDGEQYSLDLGAGYDFNMDGLTFGPYARMNYAKIDIDKYTEEIAPNSRPGYGLALTIDDQDIRSLTSFLGAQASYSISTSWAVLEPQTRCEWVHEYANDSRNIKARFVYDPTFTFFSFKTDKPDRDYVNLGIGLSAVFPKKISSFVYYEPVLGLDDVTSHHVVAGIRYEF
jgi:outer membrane autotransporter protein